MSEVRVYPNALLGYRAWVVKNGALYSTGKGESYWDQLTRARCNRPDSGHVAPEATCECGLYAHHQPWRALSMAQGINFPDIWGLDAIAGAVAARGRVEIHADGFRCQEAAVLGLLFLPHHGGSLRELAEARRLADSYDVPLFTDFDGLEAFARRHASPAPFTERRTARTTNDLSSAA